MTTLNAKRRIGRLAAKQFGRVSRRQLTERGVSSATIDGWMKSGYLYRLLPHVYAVGHRAKTIEADLAAALLYAGPQAMLSHATAAWWVGAATDRPHKIHVSTPRRCRSIPGIRVHDRRPLTRAEHKGLPVTEFPQTMLDYATMASLSKVRLALASADYEGHLNLGAIEEALGRPHQGSAKLREALKSHQPMLADARSRLELGLFEHLENRGLPLPELGGYVKGWPVDLLWRKQKLAVELDGTGNHRTRAQVRRDRRKEFELRANSLLVIRYSDEQVTHHAKQVIEEITQLVADRTQRKAA